MADNPARSGWRYQKAVRALKARGDQQCWRCGKWLSAEAKWPARNCITLGHIIALEDGGDPYSPDNHAAECIKCNMGDGARRTNAKRREAEYREKRSYRSDEWYFAYQIGKPMVLEIIKKPKVKPAPATRPCAICNTQTTRRKYCSDACAAERQARYMRDKYRARVGLPIHGGPVANPRKREAFGFL